MGPEIYVLRHGETGWNAEGRMQGSALNSALTAKGRAQAARQGALMAGVDLSEFDILVSPLGRAVETAAIALAPHVALLHTDARLVEIGVGGWAGRRRADLGITGNWVETPDGVLELYDMAPGGEGFEGLRLRCAAFLDSLVRPAVLVTHGITSRMLRHLALGAASPGLSDMPGGQGVVYHVKNNVQRTLE
jgi:broad specificity phosphatase PhoE